MGSHVNGQFPEEDTQMASIQKEICSFLSVTSDMQTKTATGCLVSLIPNVSHLKVSSLDKDWARELTHAAGGSVNWFCCIGELFRVYVWKSLVKIALIPDVFQNLFS